LGDTAAALALLASGADANASGTDLDGPVLHMAAVRGDHNVVRALLKMGARVDEHRFESWYRSLDDTMQSDDCGSAILAAARAHQLDVVEVLLQHGASASEALGGAVDARDARIAKFALDRNAMPSTLLLALAATRADLATVLVLLEYGADPNASIVDGDGAPTTPLLCALREANEPVARALLAAGAKKPHPRTLAKLRREMLESKHLQLDDVSSALGLRKARR
jgi:ankyrin repeat protein